AERALEAELLRDRLRVDGIRHASERARAKRRDRRAVARLGDAPAVAAKRLDVRHEVVRERDRLRALEVRVPGHRRVHFELGALEKRERETLHRTVERVEQLDDEEAQVERDLVVAAAGGVKLPAEGADALGEHALHGGMHILSVTGHANVPPPISSAMLSSAETIRAASSFAMIPCRPSIRACAMLPRTSCSAMRLSSSSEAVKARMRGSSDPSKRPDQSGFALTASSARRVASRTFPRTTPSSGRRARPRCPFPREPAYAPACAATCRRR